MSPVRSLLALLVGMGLFRLVVAVLETVLVGAAANGPVSIKAALPAGYAMTKVAGASVRVRATGYL